MRIDSKFTPDPWRDHRITQKQLAAALGVSQSSLSQLEHREDFQLTTLRKAVQALRGELDVIARFPDRIVALKVA